MKHGSLFSGIGGFDLAAEWMGWENVFHCEISEFPRKILKYHFPKSICYEDIKKTDFTKHRGEIDIISGGFPCQPYSNAGKRKGKDDDRHLWPEMLRVIREIQPRFVVGENVVGLLSWNNGMVFHEIITDLENEGYETQAFLIPACATNAPHRRDRIWFVAYANNTRTNERVQSNGKRKENDEQRNGQSQSEHWENGINGNVADTESQRTREQSSKDRGREDRRFDNNGKEGNVADTSNERLQRSKVIGGISPGRQERNKFLTRRFCSNWENFPTKSPICGGDDGIPTQLDGITFSKWRNESIKGYGNAVVPQVVYQIFKAIEQSIAE
jgi:DNA (cytosine-5)-methyltransferase 1